MEFKQPVVEYACPCCGAGLKFGEHVQKMTCEYCDNEFELDTVKAFCEAEKKPDEYSQWETHVDRQWSDDEASAVRSYTCQSCGGELITDNNTIATFCPYCDNPTILPDRSSGTLRPDAVIPFKKSREDAITAFKEICKKKILLPKEFLGQHRIEKITGIYVPFWLYDCVSEFRANYRATRVRHWSDSRYHYTKTEHFLLFREADAEFRSIPMDASIKMNDAIMESIEPYNFDDLVDFEMSYLSGFLADRYDVESPEGHGRVRDRVAATMQDLVSPSLLGYSTVIPTTKSTNIQHGNAKYVLLPVWMLHTKYKDKNYVFAMNGQTGKITGTFPVSFQKAAVWYAGLTFGITAIGSLLAILL